MVQVSWVNMFVSDFWQLSEKGFTLHLCDSDCSSKSCSKMGLRLKTLFTSTLFINNPKEATPQNAPWQEYSAKFAAGTVWQESCQQSLPRQGFIPATGCLLHICDFIKESRGREIIQPHPVTGFSATGPRVLTHNPVLFHHFAYTVNTSQKQDGRSSSERNYQERGVWIK